MKTSTYLINLLLLLALVTSCCLEDQHVTPSNEVTTHTIEVGSFSSLDISDSFSVFVTLADQEAPVQVEANNNLHPYIRIVNHNGHLDIELDERIDIDDGNAVLNVYVTARTLYDIEASGASYVELLNPLYDDALVIELSGASMLRGILHTNEITADLSGASALQIQGSTVDFRIDASGASFMEGFDFVVSRLDANLDGASQASLTVEDEIKINASGSSLLRYKGDAVITHQDLSGSSSVVKMD